MKLKSKFILVHVLRTRVTKTLNKIYTINNNLSVINLIKFNKNY